MKTVKFCLLSIFFISLISCSKDENTPKEKSANLEGTWNLVEFNYEGYTDSKIDGIEMHTDYEGVAENINATTTFHANGTFESKGSYDIILTGEGMTIPHRDLSYASEGNYQVSGNTIEVTNFQGESRPGALVASSEKTMTIVELTSTRLVLDFTEDVTITEGSDEAFISNTGKYIFTR